MDMGGLDMKYRIIELIPFILFMSLVLYVVNDFYMYMEWSRTIGVIIFAGQSLVMFLVGRMKD